MAILELNSRESYKNLATSLYAVRAAPILFLLILTSLDMFYRMTLQGVYSVDGSQGEVHTIVVLVSHRVDDHPLNVFRSSSHRATDFGTANSVSSRCGYER